VPAMERVASSTRALRKKTTTELERLGYTVLPSDTNFFMVDLKREVRPVIDAFRGRGILVGRPFPPMTRHLRVSVGTEQEMQRFLRAFPQVIAGSA
ncbi:MAG TPA: aminotransferase class I/II-fold pyridoxal phosphate-dependent enzyme, partial [Vicinamibacterales bacterium]